MPNRKKSNSKEELSTQRIHTHANKIKKYQALLAGKGNAVLPSPKEIKIWNEKLKYSLEKI